MFSPPRCDPTAQWISEHFYLPPESGDISGLYDFYYTPYFFGVALALDDPLVEEVDLMKAAQIGWTYFLIGYLCKRIYEAATGRQCPILALFAKEKDGKAFHDEKLILAVTANRSLDGLIDVTTSRKSGNRWDFKRFINGFLKLVGSNSPGNVKSTSSVGVAIVEEPDDTSENVHDQGDAIGLAEERLKRYQGSKLIVGGTPAVKGLSRTEERLSLSDARVLPVACHECGEKHVLNFDNVWWAGKDGKADADAETGVIAAIRHEVYGFAQPDTAVYMCPHCRTEWDDYQRQKNIRDTINRALEEGDSKAGWVATKPFHGKAGFQELGEVYSCLPGSGLADMVREHLHAQHQAALGDQTKMIRFTNQKLGRPYEYRGDQAEPDALRAVAREYPELQVPDGGLLVTAGVDVQHDRLAVVLRAWGRGEESWLLYWGELPVSHTAVEWQDPVWRALDQLVLGAIPHANGCGMRVSAISIDSSDGATNDAVYHWVRSRQHKHPRVLIMAVKGSSAQQDPEIFALPARKSIDHHNPQRATKADRYGIRVYLAGTSKAKDWINGQLKLEADGRGRFHFYSGVRDDYFDQLTAEVKAPHRGVRFRLIWQLKSGRRNEGLDCEVYALHAARARKVHLLTPAKWDYLESQLQQPDMFGDPGLAAAAVNQGDPQPVRRRPSPPVRAGNGAGRRIPMR